MPNPKYLASILFIIFAPVAADAQASDPFVVRTELVADRKAVFATVESIDTVVARARIGGTIGELRVDEGDAIEAGSVLAVVVDDRLAPQIGAVNARASSFSAQLSQARIEFERANDLFDRGIFPQARLDQANTAVVVLEGQLASIRRERDVLVQQAREGDVLAPTSGRVLNVSVSAGSVILPGEPVAVIASELYLLRLSLPERHAHNIQEGDTIEVDTSSLPAGVATTGQIRQVYPQIEDGRVIADAVVAGLGSFFVGERVRVFVMVEERPAINVPPDFLETRFGVDYVHLLNAQGGTIQVAVLRGRETAAGVEVLAGLSDGDRLVRP